MKKAIEFFNAVCNGVSRIETVSLTIARIMVMDNIDEIEHMYMLNATVEDVVSIFIQQQNHK